ncbi:MAG TPA: GTP-binding protein, partial [Caulobacteraceae bacterium]
MGAQRDAVDQLRLMTCGSVDDGKSTLIGRLLWETGSVPADEIERVRRESVALGRAFDPALLLDGLEAERAQQITIDIAWRYFGTARRRFVVADAPGHEEHTRNMVGAATQVDLAVLLADAARGATVQTLRHARLAAMFGVRTFVLAVNKMDAAGFDPAAFDRLVALGRRLEDELGAGVVAIPLSARDGDNVVARSQRTPWYGGPTLLEALEAAPVEDDAANRPLRLPVQWVNRADGFRGYAGSVASGRVRRGERVRVAGSGREATVARLLTPDGDAEAAAAG